MDKSENIYRRLQEHLDKQAVGFPATKSGVEIALLEELYTPEQVRLALFLSYKPQTLSEIAEQASGLNLSSEEVRRMLNRMANNGAVGITQVDGADGYYLMPFLIGMIELHDHKASPDFYKNYSAYFGEGFARAFLSTKVSQMRTIPVEQSIENENIIATYDHIIEVIRRSAGPIAITPCMCREGAKKRGKPCKVTSREDTCMILGDWAHNAISKGSAVGISQDEAIEILRLNQADGLVLQPTNYQNPDFICSCCGDCCGVLSIEKKLSKPAARWAHNYTAVAEAESCLGCGVCIDRCQMDALTMDEGTNCVTVDADRCFGCGNCVVTCPSGALKLEQRENVTAPPESRLGLYEILVKKHK